MQPASWYINRLRLMSPREVVSRAAHTITRRFDAVAASGAAPRATRATSLALGAWPAPNDVRASDHLRAADDIMQGRFDIFGRQLDLGFPDPQWNRDPASGITAPPMTGTALDYRDARRVGSARHTWELNRHYALVALGQAHALSRDERYRSAGRDLLASWLVASPHPVGINWVSALEHGIRLINWYLASRLFGWSAAHEPARGFQDSIYWHCRFIWRHRSRYSSANNHLIGEMAGLYIAASAWPLWKESRVWRKRARAILEVEAERQVHADGVGKEQTIGYQFFVLQFLIVAGLAGEMSSDPFPERFWRRIRSMIRFLRSVADVKGHLPDFGDSDDGVVYRLSPDERASRLSDLVAFEQRCERANDADASGLRADDSRSDGSGADVWLASGFPAPSRWPRGEWPRLTAFPQGGYYVLGDAVGRSDEVLLTVDAGPLGYLSIAAHGHADCLSFCMSIAGEPVLIDPGTYCYHSDPAWRNYFRGTSAHNTVRVDDCDQSEIAGPFMWLQKAEPRVDRADTEGAIRHLRASHDGYRRLPDPVTHVRDIRLDASARAVRVIDCITARSEHQVERFWHFAPDCTVIADQSGVVRVARGALRMTIGFDEEMHGGERPEVRILRGSEAPQAGWVSPRFGEKLETSTVIVRRRTSGNAELTTRIGWTIP